MNDYLIPIGAILGPILTFLGLFVVSRLRLERLEKIQQILTQQPDNEEVKALLTREIRRARTTSHRWAIRYNRYLDMPRRHPGDGGIAIPSTLMLLGISTPLGCIARIIKDEFWFTGQPLEDGLHHAFTATVWPYIGLLGLAVVSFCVWHLNQDEDKFRKRLYELTGEDQYKDS